MKKVIFAQPWGGLGDNLCFSTLPERYNEIGVEFYVSNQNTIRNNEIYDLVWGQNPFVKGVINESPNIGSEINNVYWRNVNKLNGDYIIEDIETAHGFTPKNKSPKIYYKPKNIELLKDKKVINLSSISLKYDSDKIKDFLLKNNVITEESILLKYKNNEGININDNYHNNRHNIYNIPLNNIFEVKDIFHLCDIINSCEEIVTLHSGSSALTSALSEGKTNKCLTVSLKGCEKSHIYDNIKYIFL